VFKLKRTLVVTGAVVAAGALVATAAYAIVVGRTGTTSERQTFVHNTSAFSTTSGAFTNVTSAVRSVTISSGTVRMLDARFTAESQCVGNTGWCSVRIVVVASNGAVTELDPASGSDFAFDSAAGGDTWEGHAIERTSRFLSAGTYSVRVQARVVSGATRVRLDDWSLAVEVIRP
jgi:hypothetical protein